jgi:hypothetical protein
MKSSTSYFSDLFSVLFCMTLVSACGGSESNISNNVNSNTNDNTTEQQEEPSGNYGTLTLRNLPTMDTFSPCRIVLAMNDSVAFGCQHNSGEMVMLSIAKYSSGTDVFFHHGKSVNGAPTSYTYSTDDAKGVEFNPKNKSVRFNNAAIPLYAVTGAVNVPTTPLIINGVLNY